MLCDNCGKEGARVRHVNRTYGRRENLLVVQNIPVITCAYCGGSYLTAETLRQIDQIKRNRQSMATKRPVAVVEFA